MLTKLTILVVGVVLLASSIESKSFPKYIPKCSIKDDTFSSCAVEAAKKALPSLLAGDKAHKIPKLNPLKLPILQLDASGLNLTLKNTVISGAETVNVNSVKYDQQSSKFTVDMLFDQLKIDGDYTVSGKILILPIVGDGKGILNFKKSHLVFTFDVKTGKDGKIKIENPNLETDFGGASFQLDNLFNGDKRLGDEMNKFLNENWKEVLTEFQELIRTPMNAVLHSVASGIMDNLTHDQVFA